MTNSISDIYGQRKKSVGVTITNHNKEMILQVSCFSEVALLPYNCSTTVACYDPSQIEMKLVQLMEVKGNGKV